MVGIRGVVQTVRNAEWYTRWGYGWYSGGGDTGGTGPVGIGCVQTGGDTEWYTCRWGNTVVQSSWNTAGHFLKAEPNLPSNLITNVHKGTSAQRVECVFTQNPQITVYSSLIHNCQKLKATRISFKVEWISKMWLCQMTEDYSAIK